MGIFSQHDICNMEDSAQCLSSAPLMFCKLGMRGCSDILEQIFMEGFAVKVFTFINLICCALLFGDICGAASDPLSWRIEYDDANRVVRKIDPAGQRTLIVYEEDKHGNLQRVTKTPSKGKSVVLQLDVRGRPVKMSDDGGSVDYGYDDFGRLKQVQRRGGPAVSCGYDTQDRVTQLQVADFYRVDYSYDFLGRVESVKTPAGAILFEYQTGQGSLVRTLPNGVKTIWEYEPNGQLRRLVHVGAGEKILAEYTYQYRPDGLIDAILERSSGGALVTKYQYDLVGSLVLVKGSSGEEYSCEYDQLGNKAKSTQTGKPPRVCEFDAVGRLTSIDGKPCTHDAAGNLTAIPFENAELRFSYTSEGLLKDVGPGRVTYRYDGNGRLISRKAGSMETTFIPDPLSPYWQPLVLEEMGGRRTLVVWDGAAPLMMIRDGEPEYLLHDHLGSVRLVLDAQGKVIQRIDYDPFGKPADPATQGDFVPRFAGLFWEPEAQAYLTQARAYVPELGRFLQPDPEKRVPSGSQKDLSFYAYCGGDPVNFVDINGAEARRPESVDVQEFWWGAFWDSFWRGGGRPITFDPPLIRDHVIDEMVVNAFRETTGGPPEEHFSRAWLKLYQWRYPKSESQKYPEKYHGNDVERMPNRYELQIAENKLYAWQTVYTGSHLLKGLRWLDKPRGKAAADIMLQREIPGWQSLHGIGEFFHINPQAILRFNFRNAWTKDGWLPQTPELIREQKSGVRSALNILGAEDAQNLFVKGLGDRYAKPMPSFPESKIEKPKPLDQSKLIRPLDLYPPFLPPRARRDWDMIGRDEPWRSGGGGTVGSTARPSRVGGVYLGGAGKSLDGVGLLDGIALDSNNNLILVGTDGSSMHLPPLRVDDVVTIFRSVYLYGEGPTVTIDPASRNPEESAMIIRHGKATEDTYVGWVLYQADRLMKGYTLGVDNQTVKDIVCSIPDYPAVLETIYFGGGDPEKRQKQGHWERFWIVPAEARRFEGPRRELTLMDVPLKVKTQSMKWEGGKLVDDLQARSSEGAAAFTDWFTSHYELIAKEQLLTPPKESGITSPVPVFVELRRIALITAIAEKLREQGVPMPFWMRDYAVQPVPFEKTTPGLLVTRTNDKVQARIFGGVELSPASKDVKVFTASSNIGKLPPDERTTIQSSLKLVGELEKAVQTATAGVEPLEPQRIKHKGEQLQAFTMPGAETLAANPCRLEEVDVSVPLSSGPPVRLVRSFHSFFEPSGPWGKGWALDLPRLVEVREPIHREGSEVQYRNGYDLVTPLNSISARFTKMQKVPAIGAEILVPDEECICFGLSETKSDFLSAETLVLLLKDGGSWHFTKGGLLVAVESGACRTVYERDGAGRVNRILGLVGRQKEAEIELHYGPGDLLETAEGKNSAGSETVRYQYDETGRLTGIISSTGAMGYQYDGPWVSTVTWREANEKGLSGKEEVIRSFDYSAMGQLVGETYGGKEKIRYKTTRGPQGTTVKISDSKQSGLETTTRFDTAMRPLEATYADGTHAAWSYPPQGGVELAITAKQGNTMRIRESEDGRRRVIEPPYGPATVMNFDDAGRLVSLSADGQTLLTQHWLDDGRLDRIENETCAAWQEYNEDGLLSSVILAPPDEQGQFKHFQETIVDRKHRPVEMKDHSGLHMLVQYDGSGQITSLINRRDGKNYGANIERDSDGRVREVKSSWENEYYSYDSSGELKSVKVEKMGKTATVQFQSGLPAQIEQFDGGETFIIYHDKGKPAGLPEKVISANGLTLTYGYDTAARLSRVDVGELSRVSLDYDSKGRVVSFTWSPYKTTE